ncbi:hypothetical protein PPYR_00213 [Photinus pyralis]|uniref:Regulatory protein zeste n=1 Tax=Photinus pyralis TaxID=7054 RepID=A0A5N4B118_PHOPY|nr:hypothetical protein PPYR_00213 [Photinus pyralis]
MSTQITSKKARSSKITAGQYSLYLEELQANESFRTNKFKNPSILDETWNSLAVKLNAAGGPIKTVPQWKERFADWKCNVRKKARKLELSRVRTGGGPPDVPLSDLENRLLNLSGRAVVNGIEGIRELGYAVEPPPAVQPPPAVKPPPAVYPPAAVRAPATKKKLTLAASVRTLMDDATRD